MKLKFSHRIIFLRPLKLLTIFIKNNSNGIAWQKMEGHKRFLVNILDSIKSIT